jgi:low affinity Fe/Cu permease
MMASIFGRFARWTERQLGHPITFAVACLSTVLWGVTGPFFGWRPECEIKELKSKFVEAPSSSDPAAVS